MSEYKGLSLWQMLKLLMMDMMLASLALFFMALDCIAPRRKREDNLLEPLEISRCPVCKSARIMPVQNDPEVWECVYCMYAFSPTERMKERRRLTQSWIEADPDDLDWP